MKCFRQVYFLNQIKQKSFMFPRFRLYEMKIQRMLEVCPSYSNELVFLALKEILRKIKKSLKFLLECLIFFVINKSDINKNISV